MAVVFSRGSVRPPVMSDEVDNNVYTSSESDGNGELKDPMAQRRAGGRNGEASVVTTTKKSSSKDPSRPKRKKARRACHACQRAHLTCGAFISSSPSHWSFVL